MLSLAQSKQKSEAFVKEACRYLDLNPDSMDGLSGDDT